MNKKIGAIGIMLVAIGGSIEASSFIALCIPYGLVLVGMLLIGTAVQR